MIMSKATTCSGEQNRLQLLRSYGILDTGPEEGFDDITRAAALICGAPIATITLIERAHSKFQNRLILTGGFRHPAMCWFD